jgi:protein-disulfide isomerase
MASATVDGLPVLGPVAAPVTILAFLDYDCPYCARAEHTIAELRERHPDDVRVVIANRPMPFHEHARGAARASLAAAALGRGDARFERMHRLLFENEGARSVEALGGLAVRAGLDPRELATLSESPTVKEDLARSEALADMLGVTGTPTFFVNGRRIVGAQPIDVFDGAVAQALSHNDDERPAPPPFVGETKTMGGALLLGSPSAPKTILLFADLECPYCARLDAQLREFARSRSDVRVLLRHKPLPMHTRARLAAKGAIAAAAQGKLSQFVELAFSSRALDRASLEAQAAALGLDAARFAHDLDAPAVETALAEDEALAAKLGVTGTPTAFAEGHRVIGAQPPAVFREALDR